VSVKVARAAINEYENLGGTVEEFREPLAREILRSITARPAIPLTGLGFVVLAGLYLLGVSGVPDAELMFRGEAKSVVSADVGRNREVNAGPRILTGSDPGVLRSATVAGEPHSASPANADRNAQLKSHETLSYSVQSGDTIEGIALRHFGSEAKIQSVIKANPQLRDVNRIYPGDTIFLPADSTQRDKNGSR